MNEDELNAIEARATAATPGPWKASPNYLIGGWWVQDNATRERESSVADFSTEEDAVFIAAARIDVPALILEVRRLRADNAELLEANEGVLQAEMEARQLYLRDNAEVQRLQFILKALRDGHEWECDYLNKRGECDCAIRYIIKIPSPVFTDAEVEQIREGWIKFAARLPNTTEHIEGTYDTPENKQ